MKSTNHLALFAKFWRPGSVKTRLAKSIGSELAAQIYFQFLNYLLLQLRETGDVRTIAYSPHSQRNEFELRWGSNWELVPQVSGDLGARMKSFFADKLSPLDPETKAIPKSQFTPGQSESGHLNSTQKPLIIKNVDAEFGSTKKRAPNQKVVLIGSDCPLLGTSQIDEAFDRLDRQPVVIGPSSDGGYYLIGMRNEVAEIFDHIQWSTSEVLPQTIQRLTDAKIGFELLPELTDIDEWSDLQEFLIRSAANSAMEKQHGPWLAKINSMLADVRLNDRKSSDPESLK